MLRSLPLRLLWAFALFGLLQAPAWPDEAPASPKSLAVLDLSLTGDTGDNRRDAEWRQRLADMTAALREEIRRSGLYPLVDHASIPELIAQLQTAPYLHACNGCELEIAKRAGAERVLVGWVFRMSNLVLTLHIEIRDVATGRTLVNRAYDFRGDNDASWRRAIAYFTTNMRDRPPQER